MAPKLTARRVVPERLLGGFGVVLGWPSGGWPIAYIHTMSRTTATRRVPSVWLAGWFVCLFVYSERLLFDTSHLSTHY